MRSRTRAPPKRGLKMAAILSSRFACAPHHSHVTIQAFILRGFPLGIDRTLPRFSSSYNMTAFMLQGPYKYLKLNSLLPTHLPTAHALTHSDLLSSNRGLCRSRSGNGLRGSVAGSVLVQSRRRQSDTLPCRCT